MIIMKESPNILVSDAHFYAGSLVAQLVKNLPTVQETWVGEISWRRERLSTPVFWPREFHRLYSPWGRKKSAMTEWLSHNSHGISYSILSNTEPMGSIIPRTGLKRMGLTLILIIICISVSIKIIVAISACICKQATKIVTKEMPQTQVNIFHSENMVSYINMKKLQKIDLHS